MGFPPPPQKNRIMPYTTTQNSYVTKLTSYGVLVVGGNFHINEAKWAKSHIFGSLAVG